MPTKSKQIKKGYQKNFFSQNWFLWTNFVAICNNNVTLIVQYNVPDGYTNNWH